MAEFDPYSDRTIAFEGLQSIDDWQVKVYSISQHDRFQAAQSLHDVQAQLPTLLAAVKQSPLPLHRHAFVIVHEAREGIWVLLSWWTGGEMLETITRFVRYAAPEELLPSPHTGALVCVWELEVILHERQAWIRHVLSKAVEPDYARYQTDVLHD